LAAGAPAIRAQWAVIDVGAIAQLVEQVAAMYQQLETARNTLRQAEQQYRAMTGGRGMDRLLSGTDRNYLLTEHIERWARACKRSSMTTLC
jgi:hypothetical protein